MNLIKREHGWLDPFDMVSGLQEQMNRFLSSSLRRYKDDGFAKFFAPEIDLAEEGDHYILTADLPGIRKEDLNISVTGSVLTLKGERKDELEKKGKNFYHLERSLGQFQRIVEFPTEVNADEIKASYKDGILELRVPKSESAKPKQIKVDVK